MAAAASHCRPQQNFQRLLQFMLWQGGRAGRCLKLMMAWHAVHSVLSRSARTGPARTAKHVDAPDPQACNTLAELCHALPVGQASQAGIPYSPACSPGDKGCHGLIRRPRLHLVVGALALLALAALELVSGGLHWDGVHCGQAVEKPALAEGAHALLALALPSVATLHGQMWHQLGVASHCRQRQLRACLTEEGAASNSFFSRMRAFSSFLASLASSSGGRLCSTSGAISPLSTCDWSHRQKRGVTPQHCARASSAGRSPQGTGVIQRGVSKRARASHTSGAIS